MIDRLRDEPERFELFQLIRLLERSLARSGASKTGRVGDDERPDREAIRFRMAVTERFASAEVDSVRDASDSGSGRVEVTTGAFGLAGPAGALPAHYTTLLLERLRARDDTLRRFLDQFNHRLLSLFYRAWRKHRFPVEFEERSDAGKADDRFTTLLRCLVGLGEPGKRARLGVGDLDVVFYAGLFRRRVRSPVGLRRLLEEYLGTPTAVEEFRPQRTRLETRERSRLPRRDEHAQAFNQLGRNTTLGARILDVQGGFRLRVGPVDVQTFEGCLPGRELQDRVFAVTRLYAGVEFDFDVQPVLRAEDVPRTRIGSQASPSSLGRNSWLLGRPSQEDRDDAVFSLDRRSVE